MPVPNASDVYGTGHDPVVPPRTKEIVQVPVPVLPLVNEHGMSVSQIGGFGVTQIGVYIDDTVDETEWQNFVRSLEGIHTAGEWIKADCAQYAIDVLKVDLQRVANALNLTPKTAEVYASISRSAQGELIRINSPSFSHFRLVAALPSDEQNDWMLRAKQGNWSVSELKQQLGANKPVKGRTGDPKKLMAEYLRGMKVPISKAKKLPPEQRRMIAAELRKLVDELEGA